MGDIHSAVLCDRSLRRDILARFLAKTSDGKIRRLARMVIGHRFLCGCAYLVVQLYAHRRGRGGGRILGRNVLAPIRFDTCYCVALDLERSDIHAVAHPMKGYNQTADSSKKTYH